MERSLDIRDKVLAEFILSLAKKSSSVMQFETKLGESGAEFSVELISTLYAMITKMLPECFERKFTRTNTELENDPILAAEVQQNEGEVAAKQSRGELTSMFPGLAQKNQRNKEEIDLFDEEEPKVEQKQASKDGQSTRASKRHPESSRGAR